MKTSLNSMDSKTTHPTDTPLGTLPPRTRAALCLTEDNGKLRIMNLSGCGLIVRAEFAATLETELNAAKDLLHQKDEALQAIADEAKCHHEYNPVSGVTRLPKGYTKILNMADDALKLALTPKSPTP